MPPRTTQKRLQTASLLSALQRPCNQEGSNQKQASFDHLRAGRCLQEIHNRTRGGSRITQKGEQLRYEDFPPLSQSKNGELVHPRDRTTKQTAQRLNSLRRLSNHQIPNMGGLCIEKTLNPINLRLTVKN